MREKTQNSSYSFCCTLVLAQQKAKKDDFKASKERPTLINLLREEAGVGNCKQLNLSKQRDALEIKISIFLLVKLESWCDRCTLLMKMLYLKHSTPLFPPSKWQLHISSSSHQRFIFLRKINSVP